MADIFLSYARPDQSSALELAQELQAQGYSVWIDQKGIRGARNWSAEIVEAINGCSTLLVLISASAAASHNVAKEVQLASEKRKNILPVLLEKIELPAILEYPLAGLHRVHFQDRPSIFNALNPSYGLGVYAASSQVSSNDRDSETVRIAVLPFDDLSSQHDNQWFADGMMDELIGTLGSLDHMKVPGRSDVMHYRDRHAASREIARELGVRYLIEGGVRKANDKIRITASLNDTQRGEMLWTNKFDGSFEDVFAFQEAVSKSVVQALSLHLAPKEMKEIEARPTQNAEAYELYLKGRHEQYYLTKESYLRALDLYEQAAKLDPGFALAHIAVASLCSVYYREYSRDPKWLQRAETNLAKAETIAGETSRSLSVRGMIAWLRGNTTEAIPLLTQATKLDPKNYRAFNILGNLYLAIEQISAAVVAFQRVVELVEDTQSYFNLLAALDNDSSGQRLLVAQKALSVFERHLLREPKDQGAAVSRAFVLLWAGKEKEATEVAMTLLDCADLEDRALFNLGCLFQNLGNPQMFISLFRKAITQGFRDIGIARNQKLPGDSDIAKEFLVVLNELDEIIKQESAFYAQKDYGAVTASS
jgi:adenylate cyclase